MKLRRAPAGVLSEYQRWPERKGVGPRLREYRPFLSSAIVSSRAPSPLEGYGFAVRASWVQSVVLEYQFV